MPGRKKRPGEQARLDKEATPAADSELDWLWGEGAFICPIPGRIIEQGSHGELYAARGAYHEMWELQREESESADQNQAGEPA